MCHQFQTWLDESYTGKASSPITIVPMCQRLKPYQEHMYSTRQDQRINLHSATSGMATAQ